MRILHTSDLHLGKRLKERALTDDQQHILNQIVDLAKENKVDGVLIAGDVFDDGSSMPVDAVKMLDTFLNNLHDAGIETYMISGNHDSMDRLEYGSALFERSGVHIYSRFNGTVEKYELKNKEGEVVDIYLLPFLKPALARDYYPEVTDSNSAIKKILENIQVDKGRRSILVTHLNVVSGDQEPILSGSERKYIGGEEAVNASNFDMFDYVALGHIHSPQFIWRETVRYSGAPLKYTGAVTESQKSVTIIDVGDEITFEEIPLKPKRDIRLLKGPLDKLIEEGLKEEQDRDDYIFAQIDFEEMNAMARLREVYPNTMAVSVLNKSIEEGELELEVDVDEINLMDEFEEFYKAKMGEELSESQREIVREILEITGAMQ